jgi:5-methylcytosine-specific restriction endonuclease McrA
MHAPDCKPYWDFLSLPCVPPEGEVMSRRRHNVDRGLTETEEFGDSRSYVTHKGEEFRFGKDKTCLRIDCFTRDGYTCTACGEEKPSWDLDMHHVVPLGKGGDDKLSNVTTRCKWGDCHKKEHVSVQWGAANDVRLVAR